MICRRVNKWYEISEFERPAFRRYASLFLSLGLVLCLLAFSRHESAASFCATPGTDGSPSSLSGTINTYYPGTASVSAGATSIPVGSSSGNLTQIATGDLLLIIQMQDADIHYTNDSYYGANVLNAGSGYTALNQTGVYEYVLATGAVSGGHVSISSGLVNNYRIRAASATSGQSSYQVIRVPQYLSATVTGTVNALPWNGSVGGIVAMDVAGTLTVNGTITADGAGFRGGFGRKLAGGSGANTDYLTSYLVNVNGSKGEGIAGSPQYMNSPATFNGAPVQAGTLGSGYPDGTTTNASYARGAPGNAGGGGTDGNPAGNDQNSGGGGGGNYAAGAQGGNSWSSASLVGGKGGSAVAGLAFNRVIMGGGGGAGSNNNGQDDNTTYANPPGIACTDITTTGKCSSGAPGGGIVLIRANSIAGSGTVSANGGSGYNIGADAAGGGGGGGSVVLDIQTGGSVTVAVKGGDGGNAERSADGSAYPGNRHGPGGAGSGGYIAYSPVGLSISATVTQGTSGKTTTAADSYGTGSAVGGISSYKTPNSSGPLPGADCLFKISGTVFEDVNYGGGAGRDRSAVGTVVRSGARVELFDNSGNYIGFATTDGSGAYTFAGLTLGTYTVRVVNSSVTSSRSGYVAGLLPVQTYRTDASSGSAVAVSDHVGGEVPAKADAGNGSTTLAALTTATTAPQSITTVTLSTADVTGIDFGFNFGTVVNTNNSGQGSLRQFLTNANALSNSGLAQAGRAAGIDNALFMISNGTAAAGLQAANNYFSGGVATISPTSVLPTTNDPVIIDGSTQPGWTSSQIIKLNGAGAGGGTNGLTVSGGNSTIKELIIDSFGGAGISISGTGGSIVSDNIIHANNRGVYDNAASDQFFRNVIYGNSGANGEGIYLDSGANGVKIYQNTIHGNSTRGISQAGGSATVRNNLITGSGGVGLYSSGGTLTESYNGITDNVTTPANSGGRSNVALSGTDLNINPLYVNAASGNFYLTECTSPAINQGIDLGADQPDMNGATAGLWNNNAPDLGALESGSSCAPSLSIVKQAWDLNGSAPLTSLTAPVGSTIAFLIYVKNTTAGPVTDLRINDTLDETAFQYIAGSLVRTSAATPPADIATDLAIFTATATGTGTNLSDAVDGDVASAMDIGGPVGIDRITIGAVAGQANLSLTLSAHSTFGLRFKVKIK